MLHCLTFPNHVFLRNTGFGEQSQFFEKPVAAIRVTGHATD